MQSYVITSVTKEKISPYFKAGMVVVNKHRELFKMVKKAIYELLANNEIKKIIDGSVLHKIFIN